jgi:two-component system, LuxR family, response regulator FixJ
VLGSSVVHVIDDDDAARDSLSFLLRAARIEVRTYDSAPKFLANIKNLPLGCIITDVRMPEMTGIELLRRLRESGNDVPVIVITGHGDIPLAVEAMKFGAADFFEKPYDDESLVAAVRGALDRQEGAAQKKAERSVFEERLATLSKREREVLEGLVAGKANKAIAFDHDISPRTVEIYRANVMTKMQASSLSELVRMALVAGILSDGSASKPS